MSYKITTISIDKKQKKWLDKKFISLSRYIAAKIKEDMDNEKS